MISLSKKGTILDIMVVGIFMIIIAITIVTLNYSYDVMKTPLVQDFTERNKTQSLEMLERSTTEYPNVFDAAIIFITFGLWISVLLGSFFLDSHPIFFIISILILIPVLVVMIFINNFWVETMEISTFITYKTSYPMTYFFGSHIFIITIAMAASVFVALYARQVG